MGTRETWAEISIEALTNNYKQLRLSYNKEVFPVLKANAYGHGDIEVGKYLEDHDSKLFCVSSLDEAIHLKENGITRDILIFSYVSPSMIIEKNGFDFIYTVANTQWIDEVESLNLKLRLHLEVNVGMNRYGIKTLDEVINISNKHKLEGIYMHFQRPEVSDLAQDQLREFRRIVDSLETKPQWVHVGNASVDLVSRENWINGVRVGLGLYGYRDDVENLIPVLSLYSRVTHLQKLYEKETIGYEYSYTVEKSGMFGTMPIGYADGFDMANSTLPLFIKNKAYSIVGKVCMDQTMLALDDSVEFYDVIELIGSNRSLKAISNVTGKSLYWLLTDIKERIERVYIK